MEFKSLLKILAIGLTFILSGCEDNGDGSSRVVISTGDTIIPLNDLQYQLPVVVQVADLNGAPIENAAVSLRATTTSYGKGFYLYQDTDIPADGTPDTWVQTVSTLCTAEDTNNNGILDAGEDSNGNFLLDPKTPTITAHPTETPTLIAGTSTLLTDENGFGYFSFTYPKSEASWVVVQFTATADGGLPENSDISSFGLGVLLSDLDPEDDPPAFLTSPYGTSANCNDTF